MGQPARGGRRAAARADRALAWIDEYGDRDGDGYVEYQRTHRPRAAEPGLEGLVGLDALRRRPARGAADRAVRGAGLRVRRAARPRRTSRPRPATTSSPTALRGPGRRAEGAVQPRLLARRPGLATSLGLDRDKQPLDGLASNMGHCLWTGIVDEEKAGPSPSTSLPRHVHRVGHPHARHVDGRLQPDQLPQRASGRTTTPSRWPGSCGTDSERGAPCDGRSPSGRWPTTMAACPSCSVACPGGARRARARTRRRARRRRGPRRRRCCSCEPCLDWTSTSRLDG